MHDQPMSYTMYKRTLLYFFVLFALGACGKTDVAEPTAVKTPTIPNLPADNIASLEEQVPSFNPPEDGKITNEQMQMYIAVKNLESELLQASKAEFREAAQRAQQLQAESTESDPGLLDSVQHAEEASAMGDSFAKLLTLDLQAAKKLGVSIEEYEWVRDSLLAAEQVRLVGADIMDIAYKGQNDGLLRLKALRKNETNPEMIQALDQSIADAEQSIRDMEADRQESAKQTEALRHNASLLETHVDDINVVNSEINKFDVLEQESKTP